MKQWKTIAIVISVMLWIALLIFVVKERPKGESIVPANQVQLSIDDLEAIAERQRLVTEILTLRYDAAVIQSKTQPAPVVPTD